MRRLETVAAPVVLATLLVWEFAATLFRTVVLGQSAGEQIGEVGEDV